MLDTYDQGKGLTELVGTVGRSGSVGTGQLVQHPRGGSIEALKVVLGSSNHYEMRSVVCRREWATVQVGIKCWCRCKRTGLDGEFQVLAMLPPKSR